MKTLITQTLSELTQASIRESSKPAIRTKLFNDDEDPRMEFNGFRCISEYDQYCDKLLNDFKAKLTELNLPEKDKILYLKDLRFDIKDLKSRLFPEDDAHFVFARVNLIKSKSSSLLKESFKKKTFSFLNVQVRCLERIEAYTRHQIKLIQEKPTQTFHSIPPLFPEAYDKEAISKRGFHMLRVYNSHSGTTCLNFNGNKADFEVFIDLVYRVNLLTHSNGKSATKTELRELFSLIGNFETAKNPNATLYEAKERAEKRENLYTRLISAYQAFKEDFYSSK